MKHDHDAFKWTFPLKKQTHERIHRNTLNILYYTSFPIHIHTLVVSHSQSIKIHWSSLRGLFLPCCWCCCCCCRIHSRSRLRDVIFVFNFQILFHFNLFTSRIELCYSFSPYLFFFFFCKLPSNSLNRSRPFDCYFTQNGPRKFFPDRILPSDVYFGRISGYVVRNTCLEVLKSNDKNEHMFSRTEQAMFSFDLVLILYLNLISFHRVSITHLYVFFFLWKRILLLLESL